MVTIINLAKSYGPRTLFEDVSLQLNPGARYGLVGANGSGKSTMMRILAGDEEASDGEVRINKGARLGVLRQDRFLDDGEIISDLAMRGDALVWNALNEQKQIADGTHANPSRIGDLEDLIVAHDGYTLEARTAAILEGLGIPVAVHQQPLGTLSGGFKLRVLLAQVLVGGADVLFLDEPTNHLDILSIRWLEKFLANYAGCAVVVSHDQRFLDNVTSHILDVDYQTVTPYTGNYSKFVIAKADTRERKEASIARAQEEIARKRSFVERFGAKATKASQAQSRLKQIEKIQVEELVESSRRAPALRFVPERPSGREVLEAENISKSYGEKRVLTDVSLRIPRGEKVAIIGPNGLGKSTLLKVLVQQLKADTGKIKWGHEVRIGYFPQDHREILDNPDATPLNTLWDLCPAEELTFVRGQLGRVLFSGGDVDKKIGKLSGGECARLIFALLAIKKPNVLILDEPTNHLDMESIAALIESLKQFEGTVIFVSHDRWFVSELATRVLEITPTGPRDFPGSYTDYLAKCGDDHLDSDTVARKARKAAEPALKEARREKEAVSESWEETKRKRNRLNKLPQLRDQAMEQITKSEARLAEIEALYCSVGFFERTSAADIKALEAEKIALGPKIEELMAQWEAFEAELNDLKGQV